MAVVFPRLNVFCCGCTLRTGVYIIAIINLILFSFIFGVDMYYAILILHRKGHVETEVEFLQSDIFQIMISNEVVFSACLVYANFKNNASYMMPYILMKTVFAGLVMMIFLFGIFMHMNGKSSLENTIIPIIVFALVFYSTVIVYSHYRNLKEGQTTSS